MYLKDMKINLKSFLISFRGTNFDDLCKRNFDIDDSLSL